MTSLFRLIQSRSLGCIATVFLLAFPALGLLTYRLASADEPSLIKGDRAAASTGDENVTEPVPPLYLTKTAPDRAKQLRDRPWIETIAAEIPPLQNAKNRRLPPGRMPMIMWHGVGFQPLGPEQIDTLRERGLCQHLQLNEASIPAAKALVAEGMPVILMEGRTDSWPYSLADELPGTPGDWAHQFDLTYQPPWFQTDDSSQWHGACPNRTQGWTEFERRTEALMRKFQDAGVRVDAVLVDYEGDPYPWSHLFDQLRHCQRCRRDLPPEVVRDKSAWRDYAWTQYVELYDKHFAQAIRRVFPDALVTNWHVVFSTAENPIRYFVRDVKLPELRPSHFSATNPIAYASDASWRELWNPQDTLSQRSVDSFYNREILHQVRTDRINRELAGMKSVKSIPWVARVCRISGGDWPLPVMSRQAYRKSLGTVWKEGIHGMQIFNTMHEGYEELALQEVQDAVAAMDASLQE